MTAKDRRRIETYRNIKIYEVPDMVGGKYYHSPDLTTDKCTVNFTPSIGLMKQFIDEELNESES